MELQNDDFKITDAFDVLELSTIGNNDLIENDMDEQEIEELSTLRQCGF